jgi:hypothetical protein
MGATEEPAAFETHEFDVMRTWIDPDTKEGPDFLFLLIHYR